MGYILAEADYLDKCTKRTRSVVKFSQSEECYESILVACLSSIPRWRYARKLSSKKAEENAPRTIEALAVLLESTRSIVKGEDPTVEHFINREENHMRIRLSTYASIMRTTLYLSEKNDLSLHGGAFVLCWVGLCDLTKFCDV